VFEAFCQPSTGYYCYCRTLIFDNESYSEVAVEGHGMPDARDAEDTELEYSMNFLTLRATDSLAD